MNERSLLTRAMDTLSSWFGSRTAFVGAIVIVVVWALFGPLLKFSDTWQLTINTGTTIVTFIVVIAVQYSQNRDTKAMQTKLDAIIAALPEASNQVLGIEAEETEAITKHQQQIKDEAATSAAGGQEP